MSDARVWIHIGLPKTGTSAVQSSFADARATLREAGLLYPETGEVGGGHARLAWPFLSPTRKERADVKEKLDEAEAERLWDTLADEVSSAGAADTLLSSEYFSEIEPHVLAGLAHRFSGGVRVLVYLRSQDELIESGYNQEVKAGLTSTEFRMPSRPVPSYDYATLLGKWSEAFGRDNITVRLYDAAIAASGAERDVAAAIGLEPTTLERSTFVANPSLHPALVELQRRLNALGEPRSALVPQLQSVVAASGERVPHLLSARQRRAILELYAESNQTVARDYFGIQNGQLFPQPDDDAPRTQHADALEFVSRAMALTWEELAGLRQEVRELSERLGPAS